MDKWIKSVKQQRVKERGGDGAGQSEETVDYESHQVINDFINRTNHGAVIGVTQGWGMILSPCSIPPPTASRLPPSPSDIASLLPRQGAGEKGMEHGVDGGGEEESEGERWEEEKWKSILKPIFN